VYTASSTLYLSSANAKLEDVASFEVEDLGVKSGVGDFLFEIGAWRLSFRSEAR
jgi:hypothetical protein